MDSLEKFVRENRDKLDLYEPSPEVWEKIRKPGSLNSTRFIFRIAAAAVVTLIVGTAIMLYSSSGRRDNLTALPAEVKEMELFYNSMVNTLYLQAKPLLTGHPEVKDELENDLARIDNICLEIKNDLKDNASNREVIEALIQNYTIKVQILEDMLRILEEIENDTEKQKSNAL